MSLQSLDDLTRDHAGPGVRWDGGPGGLPFAMVETERCRARLTPHGAHQCEWTPAGQAASVLFVSPHAVFGAGKAIRGGVPICFPWFGDHPDDASKPAHGFARTRPWQVTGLTRDAGGDIVVTLRLGADDDTRAHWNAEFAASLTVSLGTSLAMTLDIQNTGAGEIAYEAALHTYLAVGDVETIRIHGLERTWFLDKADGLRSKRGGEEPVAIHGEVDRVYLDTTAACVVDDPVLGRRLRVEKRGSDVTVVWNPGQKKGQAVADIREAWRRFVCVETANSGPHAVRLAPGAHHAMTVRIAVENP